VPLNSIQKESKMGAEGGIIICKIDDIRKKWPEIKKDILERFNRKGNSFHVWNKEKYIENIPKIQSLSDDISGMNDKEVVGFLRNFASQYDTPYLFGSFIIFSEGDNINDMDNLIVNCFPGDYVQTWS
jgi:hypothetical protein